MLFDLAHTDELKAWLAAELGPICDADPEVLSDYVLALLKHDASEAELQKLLKEQLEDFLAAETDKFVNSTFAALASKAYLASPTDAGAAPSTAADARTVTEATDSSRKRRADEAPERSSPPRQTRKLQGSASSLSSSRNGSSSQSRPAIYDEPLDTRGARARDSRERSGEVPTGPREGRDGRNPGRKQLCRDFHNMGYCPRGANCKFDHSINVMPGMPGQMPMGQFGMPPMMGPGPLGPMRPPHMGMGQGPMMFPAGPGYGGMPPQGWNPNMRPPPGMQNGAGPNGVNNGAPSASQGSSDGGLAARLGGQVPPSPHAPPEGNATGSPSGPEFGPNASGPQGPPTTMGGMAGGASGPGGRGGFAGRGRGRGGPPGHFASQRRSNTTLVIENVPAEHLDLIKVNEYFKKFGTITNISIDVPGTKALVSYSQPHEAKAAHESPDVIFGNRFVKVYFQRLDEPQASSSTSSTSGGAPGGAAQVQPRPPYQAPLKSNFVPGQTSNVYHARPPAAAGGSAPSEERKKLIEEQKQKQAQLDAQLAEQKALLGKLGDKAASADERKAAMTSLKKLGEDIQASTEAVKAAVAALSAAPTAGNAKEAVDSQQWKEQREKREKEQLDRELELHSKGASPGSTTEELRKKLESLKAEAASLGLESDGTASSGFQARGRGRGGFAPRARRGFGVYGRGRGGPMVNRSMRLDNRTTRVRVTGLPEGADRSKVQEHLKQFGEIESFSDEGAESLTVEYKARASGEQAMRSGADVPDVGSVKLSWVPAPVAPASAIASSGDENASATETAEEAGADYTGGNDEYEESDRDSSWKR